MTSEQTDFQSFQGQLLLATPDMGDPRFRFTVIYVVSHDQRGAMGIIINKGKSGLHISDMLDQIGIEGDVKVADTPVLNGGPVDIDRGFVLHSADYFKKDTSLKISDTLSLTSTKDVLEALVSDEAPERAMLAVGYAGWGRGQLEKEIMDNAWLVIEADEDLIFSNDLDGKWASALGEMGIDPSALSHGGGRA
ncbi:YqgE/AlgH family protein [Litorimonas sp. WD9-15]|uniref:YqgE/AlgH family protein n=1 Tax=Litorimonas sp. WD9-15 TaxID=3418716 RepID=UPI003CFEB939